MPSHLAERMAAQDKAREAAEKDVKAKKAKKSDKDAVVKEKQRNPPVPRVAQSGPLASSASAAGSSASVAGIVVSNPRKMVEKRAEGGSVRSAGGTGLGGKTAAASVVGGVGGAGVILGTKLTDTDVVHFLNGDDMADLRRINGVWALGVRLRLNL